MTDDDNAIKYFKGRGAQVKPHNKFLQHEYVQEHVEGVDEELFSDPKTQIFFEHPKKIINKVDSPDLGLEASMNPYQGCEHGCIYCYARNTHTYWGFNAGLDFESKIIVKKNAAELLEKELSKLNYEVKVIMLSGNTDCYQPLERKFEITRKMLQVLLKFKHPVAMITKNALIMRDLDLLKPMAEKGLVGVTISITSLQEKLRRLMEPRTASCLKRLETVKVLSENGIPVNVNLAPVIPSINSDEIPAIIKAAAEAGACDIHYTMVRLNGDVGKIFEDWVHKTFPDRAEKVLNQIKSVHGGTLNDSQFGRRMSGEGNIAQSIHQLFSVAKAKYFTGRSLPELNCDLFSLPGSVKQASMF
ncbi:MAG TPA: PA0069 family radical SAM protein [Chitinophagales bacterium]|nr:PA0069 family radical SAM protein [Chitinophagales bacterium]